MTRKPIPGMLGHLAQNPFICDCNLKWLADYLRSNPIETSGARCASPRRLANKRIGQIKSKKFRCSDVQRAVVSRSHPVSAAPSAGGCTRPLPRPSLTPRHRHQRLQWCRTRLSWSDSEWQRVIFSDESRFSLGGDAQRIRVWRHRGHRHTSRRPGVPPPPPLPHHLQELCEDVQAAWDGLSQDSIRNLYSSIPRRLACWVSEHGGPTPY
ncbi:hypothetical protein NFI96_003809 [Prochilodus magdalenae]|nr:hypothetical protein NFI96_003809 [Prochilodus magdalenae]